MFNFQKEVVVNDIDSVKGLIKKYKGALIVDKTVYSKSAVAGEPCELIIKTAPLKDKHVQILVELGLDNEYRADFGTATWYFRKPMLVDLDLKGVDDVKATVLKALKTVVPHEYKFVTVEEDGDNVKIVGDNSHVLVRKVVISEIGCGGECAAVREDDVLSKHEVACTAAVSDDYVEYTPNKVEFGTYDYLLHNLRLPTYENIRFASPSAVEMPVKGGKYTQYTFAYKVARVGLGGLSVAGQVVESVTLHTFFVLSGIVDEFEKLLGELEDAPEIKNVEEEDHGEHLVRQTNDDQAVGADL